MTGGHSDIPHTHNRDAQTLSDRPCHNSAQLDVDEAQRKRKIVIECTTTNKEKKRKERHSSSNSIDCLFAPDAVIITRLPSVSNSNSDTSPTQPSLSTAIVAPVVFPVDQDLFDFYKELDEKAQIGLNLDELLALGHVPVEVPCTEEKDDDANSEGIVSNPSSIKEAEIIQKTVTSLSDTSTSSCLFSSSHDGTANSVSSQHSEHELASAHSTQPATTVSETLEIGVIRFTPSSWNSSRTRDMLHFLKENISFVSVRPQITRDMKHIKITIKDNSLLNVTKAKGIILEWLESHKSLDLPTPSSSTTRREIQTIQSNEEQNNTISSTTTIQKEPILSSASDVSDEPLDIPETFESRTKFLPLEYWNYVRDPRTIYTSGDFCWVPTVDTREKIGEKFLDKVWSIVIKYHTDLKKEKSHDRTRFVILGTNKDNVEMSRNEIDHCILSMNVEEGDIERERHRAREKIKLEVIELEDEKQRLEMEARQEMELLDIERNLPKSDYLYKLNQKYEDVSGSSSSNRDNVYRVGYSSQQQQQTFVPRVSTESRHSSYMHHRPSQQGEYRVDRISRRRDP